MGGVQKRREVPAPASRNFHIESSPRLAGRYPPLRGRHPDVPSRGVHSSPHPPTPATSNVETLLELVSPPPCISAESHPCPSGCASQTRPGSDRVAWHRGLCAHRAFAPPPHPRLPLPPEHPPCSPRSGLAPPPHRGGRQHGVVTCSATRATRATTPPSPMPGAEPCPVPPQPSNPPLARTTHTGHPVRPRVRLPARTRPSSRALPFQSSPQARLRPLV